MRSGGKESPPSINMIYESLRDIRAVRKMRPPGPLLILLYITLCKSAKVVTKRGSDALKDLLPPLCPHDIHRGHD
ncbi:hypothetical protein EYF80_035726 [Liparis tanakae]|uniref:Uncharacterized protein n=1 Tax=Liparis tanakae TaxID=230148 RepID=A0A4Z2GL99_9TELE|nr:hypothetical protein EYF80_035726 [Liparis tanakae]